MTDDDSALIRTLLGRTRTLALAVLVDGAPWASLLPFAATADGAALLVVASGLARHTRGLSAGAAWSALLSEPDAAARNPFEIGRLTLEGRVEPIPRTAAAFEPARARFLARLPEGEMLFGLGDFGLYALGIERGRLVSGFARTVNLTPAMLAEALAG